MHPPRKDPHSTEVELEYSCELSHVDGSSMKRPREARKIEEKNREKELTGTVTLRQPPYPLGHVGTV